MHVELSALVAPILGSSLAVFIASSLIWMIFQYHESDWSRLPDEAAARKALQGVPPGEYSMPHARGAQRKTPEWQRKMTEGPVGMLVVFPSGTPNMGRQLLTWFVYCLVISLLVAYALHLALPAGATYREVFRMGGVVAILAYAGAAAQGSIWFGHGWGRTARDILDGVIYGLLTAGMFGWLWPQAA